MDRAEGRAGQVGADEDALDVDGAAFELGGLEGDDDCDAALLWVLAVLFSLSRERGNGGNGEMWLGGVRKRRGSFRAVGRSFNQLRLLLTPETSGA